MRTRIAVVVALAAVSLGSTEASAQSRFDVGLLLGSTGTTNEGAVLQFDRATTYQATFAWHVWRTPSANLSVEVPFIASPEFTVATRGGALPRDYASLYLTPGIRVTVAPRAPVSFFGAIGGGYALYTEGHTRVDGSPNPQPRDTNTGALQFGGGIDVHGFGWLGFRGEVRDLYTGPRNFSIATPTPRVHNVVASGGLVIRF